MFFWVDVIERPVLNSFWECFGMFWPPFPHEKDWNGVFYWFLSILPKPNIAVIL